MKYFLLWSSKKSCAASGSYAVDHHGGMMLHKLSLIPAWRRSKFPMKLHNPHDVLTRTCSGCSASVGWLCATATYCSAQTSQQVCLPAPNRQLPALQDDLDLRHTEHRLQPVCKCLLHLGFNLSSVQVGRLWRGALGSLGLGERALLGSAARRRGH